MKSNIIENSIRYILEIKPNEKTKWLGYSIGPYTYKEIINLYKSEITLHPNLIGKLRIVKEEKLRTLIDIPDEKNQLHLNFSSSSSSSSSL